MTKKLLSIFSLLFIVMFAFSQNKADEIVKNIHWFGQSSILIESTTANIFIDPVNIKKNVKADIILITHSHGDHFSKDDIKKISKEGSIVIAPFDIDGKNKVLTPGKSITIKGIKIDVVPAYNIKKTQFHPRTNNFVGYIITIDGVKIYHAGDTERIPEMKNISCDIALLPLGQTYTMESVDDAIQSALDVKAKIAIPIHFGMYEGTNEDAKKFVDELSKKGVKSFILNKE